VTKETLRSSYIYRCYCEGMGPRLDHEGQNSAGKSPEALVMDFNCLDIGNGRRAMNHNAKTITILFKDLHVEKISNPAGMETDRNGVPRSPLVLQADEFQRYPQLWMAADEAVAW